MKTYCQRLGLSLLGLGLVVLATSCNSLRERDLLTRQGELREATPLTAVPKAAPYSGKMLVRTQDGVAVVDDFSAQASKASGARRADRQREAARHQALAMKSQYLLPQ